MKTFYAQEPHVDGTTQYKPGDKRVADENDVAHLVGLGVLGDKPPKGAATGDKGETTPANKTETVPANGTATGSEVIGPDYERDSLHELVLADASKDQLLVIAAYEQADVPEGDKATKPQIVKAIEAKRG